MGPTTKYVRDSWSAEKVRRLRAMIAAGLTGADICSTLEDEFGGTCTEEMLRLRIREHGLCPPRSTTSRPPPWSEAKMKRLGELVAAKLSHLRYHSSEPFPRPVVK